MARDTDPDLEGARQTILRWRKGGPALFAVEALGVPAEWDPVTRQGVTEQQWEASRLLVECRRLSIRSGHGTGKSAFLAWTILWAMTCWHPVKAGATAPTATQLHDVLWSELGMWHQRMPPELKAQFRWTNERFERLDVPQEAFATARTARKEQPEALQGLHSQTMLIIVDEASGVFEEIFRAGEGSLSTEGAFVVLAGNPTRMEGFFYDSHNKDRSRWATLHWNGEDSPLVSRDYIEEMAQKYGTQSTYYRIKVKGDFAGNPDGIIALDVIESAIGREVEPFGPEVWGVDVARFGPDRTSLCRRRGNSMPVKIESWRGKDTMQTAGLLKIRYDEAEQAGRAPEAIYVDVIGLGAGVVDRCRELDLPVVGVNVSETPAVREQYSRLRDELWFLAREWFHARNVAIVRDDDLIAELTLPTYRLLSTGKKQVESKDDLKKRGVTSPDLADAFCLTFAQGKPKRKPKPMERHGAMAIGGGSWMR